jgi:hypothetical protein
MTNNDKSFLWFGLPYILLFLAVFGLAFYVSVWVGLTICGAIGFLALCIHMSEYYANK